MKKNKIIYWTSTILVSVAMLISGSIYLYDPSIIEAAHPDMGFPDYFKMELGVAKVLGAIALLLPMVPNKIKDFAYAGFTIILISAFIAHVAIDDGIKDMVMPLIILGIMVVSYRYRNKLKM